MACIKKCNGDTPSNELIVIFGLSENATTVHDALLQWFFRCLDTISDKVFEVFSAQRYGWNIITQIEDDDYEDGVDMTIKNTIRVAIHIDDYSYLPYADTEQTIIPYRYSPSIKLRPQEIMQCIINEPTFINCIGVSAVSMDVMMQWWTYMVETDMDEGEHIIDRCDIDDVNGKTMWQRITYGHILPGERYSNHSFDTEWGCWYNSEECSEQFGWKGYQKHIDE